MKTHYFQKKPMSMPHRPAVLPAAVSTAGHTRADIRRILRGPGLQAKLTIGAPDDVHEREADRVADAVMRMPDSHQQGEEETIRSRPLSDPITPLVQRQTEEEEEEPLQTKAAAGHTPEMTPQVASAIASMQEGADNRCRPRSGRFSSRVSERISAMSGFIPGPRRRSRHGGFVPGRSPWDGMSFSVRERINRKLHRDSGWWPTS